MEGLVPVIKMGSGCDYHRCILPLEDMGVDITKFSGKNFIEVAKETKLLFFNRTPGNITYETIMMLQKQHGFKICLDLDDYWVLHPKHNLGFVWRVMDMEQELQRWVKSADAVTVTTSLLADKIRLLNPNVHVIPNALPYGKNQFLNARIESEYTRFLYAGGGSHFWDMKELSVPFTKVNNNPNFKNSQFILCGFHAVPGHPESEREWLKIENVFNLNGKLKNYVRRNTLPLHGYMNHYHHADIAVIPLEKNNFNRFKSNLKILEAGCNDTPVIVSDVEPYSPFPNRDLIMFAKNAREWVYYLQYCVKNPNFVRERGKELGEYVRANYYLTKINEYRKQLFEHLIK